MIFRSQSRYKRFQCIMPIIMLPARDYRSRWIVMLTHVTRLLWYLSAQSAWIVNVNIDFGVLRTMILKTWTWACTSWKHYWFKISSFSILNVTVGPRSNHATSINLSRSVGVFGQRYCNPVTARWNCKTGWKILINYIYPTIVFIPLVFINVLVMFWYRWRNTLILEGKKYKLQL